MVREKIIQWLKDYLEQSGMKGFVVGISGGIDSAVTSTLCAETGYPVLAVSMPIHQDPILHSRSELQKDWLFQKYADVATENVDLSKTYDAFKEVVPSSELGYANSKARLRMTTLYGLAAAHGFLVAGTGNKVEDFGVGFFTKYGDGGIDLSPIGDLTKTGVYQLAKELSIPQQIQDAPPTDGLWDDGRQDEDQLGATYPELESAMEYDGTSSLTDRQREVLEIYRKHHEVNKHKMLPIPVCKIK
jgi:NAD+ synthase